MEHTFTHDANLDAFRTLPSWIGAASSPDVVGLGVEAEPIGATSTGVPSAAHGMAVAAIACLVNIGGQADVSVGAIGGVAICGDCWNKSKRNS